MSSIYAKSQIPNVGLDSCDYIKCYLYYSKKSVPQMYYYESFVYNLTFI